MWWRWVSPFAALAIGVLNVASADTSPSIPVTAIPTVKCVYGLLKSSPAVQSVDVYVIDEFRSAVEYRFKGKDGDVIIADLRLLASPADVTYEITIPRDEPQKAEWESTEFLSSLNVSSKCPVSPAFDSVVPGPKPRAEWQHMDWPSLLPSPVSSPH
jgi:hypothetical protein